MSKVDYQNKVLPHIHSSLFIHFFLIFFTEYGESSSLQLEVFGGWTAESEHSLFYAAECRCHNSARHPESQSSRLTRDSRRAGYIMSSTVINVGSLVLLQPLISNMEL